MKNIGDGQSDVLDLIIRIGVVRWEKTLPNGVIRYYELRLQKDLWDNYVLTHVWGSRGTRLGRLIHTPVEVDNLHSFIEQVSTRRHSRGYTLTT